MGLVLDTFFYISHLTAIEIEKQLTSFYNNWDSEMYRYYIIKFKKETVKLFPWNEDEVHAICVLISWSNTFSFLVDELTEEGICDNRATRDFMGHFLTQQMPDATTPVKFRHLQEQAGFQRKMTGYREILRLKSSELNTDCEQPWRISTVICSDKKVSNTGPRGKHTRILGLIISISFLPVIL